LELTRMVSRAVRFVAFCFGAFAAGAAFAATPALVIEVDSGKVLYAERATDPWYPASITKLMTAYVALSAVREGRLTLDTPLTVSELAASMPPSKMGFPPGIEITLDNALKIIMVKSANDVATTIAEGVGGSVEGFADMMNAAARRLGMRESRFVNPHGLPDERQQTSARDMAILGRALYRDFPEQTGYFQIGAIKFGRRVMNNHNGLMGRYAGADGMKTGFICASGFNVVASATRNGRRLITVVMGSSSAAERTIKAASLFDRGFASYGWGSYTVDQLPSSNVINPPNMRPVICERRGPLPAEEDTPSIAALNGTDAGDADSGRIQMPPSVLAFAAAAAPSARPQLGPRARFAPILVWTGRTPPTFVASDDEDEKPAKKAAAPPKQQPLTRAAKVAPPANPAGTASPKPNVGAIAAKPKPAQSAAVDPSGAKPAGATKPLAIQPRAAPQPITKAVPSATTSKPALPAKPATSAKPEGQSASAAERTPIPAPVKPKQAAKAQPKVE
jgi:D-alanyl-D-alanine carboxypeptidase